MPITTISAGFIGILLLILSANVTKWRGRTKTSVGDGGNSDLLCAIRAQGNLVEYVPVLLILIGLMEYGHVSKYIVLAVAIMTVVGRYLHGWGLTRGQTPNMSRFVGTLLTFIALLVGSVAALLKGYGVI